MEAKVSINRVIDSIFITMKIKNIYLMDFLFHFNSIISFKIALNNFEIFSKILIKLNQKNLN
jgi:hypothetical protein